MCIGAGRCFYIGELGPALPVFTSFPNLGPRLVVLDSQGKRLACLSAGTAGIGPGRFIAPHGIAVDSRGDIYIGEVANTLWPWLFQGSAVPVGIPTIHKLRRLP
jgi:hypothetical protein